MQFDIRTQGIELTTALREHVQRRMSFALARFQDRLDHVAVRLSDDNGPRGGIDKRCLIRLSLTGSAKVIITEVCADMMTAIDRAADRAALTTARRLKRNREFTPTRVALAYTD